MGVKNTQFNTRGPSPLGEYVSGKFMGYQTSQLGNVLTPLSATGGNTTDTSTFPTKSVHIFTSPGTLVVTGNPGTVSILVIGGGGGGGTAYGGGGGAGAYVINNSLALTPGDYPITVGPGGTSSANGSNTVFGLPTQPAQITAPYGGAGGDRPEPGTPSPGGSGGGGGDGHPSGGKTGGTSGTYGNPGGAGATGGYPPFSGGGGGGAGGAGEPSGPPYSGANMGDGGIGANTYAYAPPTTGTPGPSPGRWFAGGGGAGNYTGQSPVPGGAGGGGAGGAAPPSSQAVRSATANTGSGGGGAPDAGGDQDGGIGGSGIVIVAIPVG